MINLFRDNRKLIYMESWQCSHLTSLSSLGLLCNREFYLAPKELWPLHLALVGNSESLRMPCLMRTGCLWSVAKVESPAMSFIIESCGINLTPVGLETEVSYVELTVELTVELQWRLGTPKLRWASLVGNTSITLLQVIAKRIVLSMTSFSSLQFSCSVVSDSLWSSWIAARQASLSITNSQSLLKLMPIDLVMPSSHLILCHPLLLLPLIFPSIEVFSNKSGRHMRWPKYWSFSFSISPSNEHPGLISFRMDWLDLFAVQGTFKSLLQHHSSKASIFQCSAFLTVQVIHTWPLEKPTLTRLTFVGKVKSLLFDMLSRLVITFLPRSKRLLISWLQSPSAVIL